MTTTTFSGRDLAKVARAALAGNSPKAADDYDSSGISCAGLLGPAAGVRRARAMGDDEMNGIRPGAHI